MQSIENGTGMPTDHSAPGGGDENDKRGSWNNKLEFLLTCVSYIVGLGNIWRFPYICMRNGGGAFLIPYFIFTFLVGVPLFYLEIAIGQFSSLSSLSVWKFCPLFSGIGIASTMVTAFVCIYYNIILAWIIYYLAHSFQWTLPWGTCDNAWNTDQCLVRASANASYIDDVTSWVNHSHGTNKSDKPASPAEEFWHYNVLEISPGIEHLGGIQWKLFGALSASCCLVFLCVIKGIKSVGKVVYVTATLPYIFLTILLIRGLMLPGATDGISFYLSMDWARLLEFNVWVEACIQMFYSLGPGWGCWITMASFNKFDKQLHIDALLVPIINCGTSFYAGFVIFSVVGFMAKDAGLEVKEVFSSGPGLAFVAYPEALTKMPLSPVWSVLFFLMVLNIGLGSLFSMVESVISCCLDQFPDLMKYFRRRWVFTAFVCILMFLCSVIFSTKAGIYFFQIVDWYCGAFTVFIVGLLECVLISFLYGIKRFQYDIECMVGSRPSALLCCLWVFITPIMIAVVAVAIMNDFSTPSYGDYTYPTWAIGFGWCLAVVSLLPIIITALMRLIKAKGNILQRLRKLTKPSDDWGPALPEHRRSYKYIIHRRTACDGQRMDRMRQI